MLVYTLCRTMPIFDFDYHNKRSNTPNNMSSRKRSNTYWVTNTFAPSVAICIISRIICQRLSVAICIGRPICLCSSAAIYIDRSIFHRWRAAICIGQPICHPESAAIYIDCTNVPTSSIRFTIHIEIHIVLSKVWCKFDSVSLGTNKFEFEQLTGCISFRMWPSILRPENNFLGTISTY